MEDRPYRHLDVERQGDVFCVRFRSRELLESDVLEIGDELVSLLLDDGCRKLVLSLGPEKLRCMYSVFLAKLVMVRRRMRECGGAMRLCDLPPELTELFEACHLKEFFEFAPDRATAVRELA